MLSTHTGWLTPACHSNSGDLKPSNGLRRQSHSCGSMHVHTRMWEHVCVCVCTHTHTLKNIINHFFKVQREFALLSFSSFFFSSLPSPFWFFLLSFSTQRKSHMQARKMLVQDVRSPGFDLELYLQDWGNQSPDTQCPVYNILPIGLSSLPSLSVFLLQN